VWIMNMYFSWRRVQEAVYRGSVVRWSRERCYRPTYTPRSITLRASYSPVFHVSWAMSSPPMRGLGDDV
jgi:hypothetical protein